MGRESKIIYNQLTASFEGAEILSGSLNFIDSSGNSISFPAYIKLALPTNTVSSSLQVDTSGFMTNDADNRVVTATGGDSQNAEANLTFNGSTLAVAGSITVTGTVDGRDVAADGTKLDGVEASADVTDATNVNAAGATMNTDTNVSGNDWVLDEDDLSSDSNQKVPTQQSVKAYVDDNASNWVLIETQTVGAAVATADFETGINSTYEYYAFILKNIVPASDGVSFAFRVGTGGTPTYQSGSSDYKWNITENGTGYNDTDDEIRLTNFGVGSAAGEEGVSGVLKMFDPSDTGIHTHFSYLGGYQSDSNNPRAVMLFGFYDSDTAVTAVRFLFSSGNVESGQISLYGIKSS